jgi:hypothetical protein
MNITFISFKSWIRLLSLIFCSICISGLGFAQMVEIGSPTSTASNYTIPVNNFYNYSYTQQIYLAEDIGMPGTITTIRFYWTGGASGLEESDNWTIYMGHKVEDSFANADDWLAYSELTEVFSGTVALSTPITTPQWVEITLSTPFEYDGISNLVIAGLEVESGYPGTGSTFRTTSVTTPGYRSIAYRSDGTAPDAASPPTGGFSNYTYNYYNNVQLELTPAESCEGEPSAGSISAPSGVCALTAFTVTGSGSTIASGIVRTWQQRIPAGTGTWTTIPGAVGMNYNNTAGITESVDYRLIVSCTASGISDTSNEVTVMLNPATDCYCTPIYSTGCSSGDDIDDVILIGATVTLSNLDTECPSGGYIDYTDDATLGVPDLIQGVSFNGNVTTNYGSPYENVRIWIDFNDNGFFEASESVATISSISSADDGAFTMDIPIDAPIGLHRMRVRLIYGSGVDPSTIDPCSSYTWGEAHDYMVSVIAPEPCSDVSFPSVAQSIASPINVCGSGTIYLKLDTLMPPATGITYQWKSSATETGTYTNVGPELTYSPNLELPGVSASLYYKCEVMCEGSVVLTSEPVLVQAVNLDDVSITMSDGQTCGPGVVSLTGTITEGSIFWYDTEIGGTPIATGESFETPVLTTTTTYYASGGAYPAQELQIGTGMAASSTSSAGIFSVYGGAKMMQMLYKAGQLMDAGATSAGSIASVAFYMSGAPGVPLNNYSVKVKAVPPGSALTWQTDGWTEVYYNAAFTPTETGWITFPFSTPFDWNGTDNIIIQVCFTPEIESVYTYAGTHRYSSVMNQCMYNNSFSLTGTCSATTGTSYYNHLPNALFTMAGCELDRVPVTAYVRPIPEPVDIGPDETICRDMGGTLTLDAGPQPDTYTFLWDNGDTTQTRVITESGEYWVTVANEFGCAVYDTVAKILLDNPVVEIGADTAICEGATLTLDAGDDGVLYYWSTGETTPQIHVYTEGNYTVLVQNEDGCMIGDTINVVIDGIMPAVDGIEITNIDPFTFSFAPVNPEYIDTYRWDFGDGTPESTSATPTHTYASDGNYDVTLTVGSQCGDVVFTTSVHILGVNNITVDPSELNVYPNPTQSQITVDNKGTLKMKSITITNVVGQTVMQKLVDNPARANVDLGQLSSGMYWLRIETDKGFVIRKVELIK